MPCTSLVHHLQGPKSAKERLPVKYKLSGVEKHTIKAYCMRLDRIGTPIRLPSIASCNDSILAGRFEARFDDDKKPVSLPHVSKT